MPGLCPRPSCGGPQRGQTARRGVRAAWAVIPAHHRHVPFILLLLLLLLVSSDAVPADVVVHDPHPAGSGERRPRVRQPAGAERPRCCPPGEGGRQGGTSGRGNPGGCPDPARRVYGARGWGPAAAPRPLPRASPARAPGLRREAAPGASLGSPLPPPLTRLCQHCPAASSCGGGGAGRARRRAARSGTAASTRPSTGPAPPSSRGRK